MSRSLMCFALLAMGACSGRYPLRTDFDYLGDPDVDASRVQQLRYVMPETGESIPYALYVPAGYDPTRQWPVMVGMMGSGLQYDWLMSIAGVLDAADRHGYILVTPLGYLRGSAFGRSSVPELNRLARRDVEHVLEIVRHAYNTDAARTYLWGHSAGASSVFYWASQGWGEWSGFGALAPGTDFNVYLDRLADRQLSPVFVQIGTADAGHDRVRDAIPAMRAKGIAVRYDEIPDGQHFVWLESPDHIEGLFEFFDDIGGRGTAER